MVIDYILDRRDGVLYCAKRFYNYVMQENEYFHMFDNLLNAMDEGTEEDVKKALNDYIDSAGYNPDIKMFVNRVNWLTDEMSMAEAIEEFEKKNGFFATMTWCPYEVKMIIDSIVLDRNYGEKNIDILLKIYRMIDRMIDDVNSGFAEGLQRVMMEAGDKYLNDMINKMVNEN